jgi:hypothetical protein
VEKHARAENGEGKRSFSPQSHREHRERIIPRKTESEKIFTTESQRTQRKNNTENTCGEVTLSFSALGFLSE